MSLTEDLMDAWEEQIPTLTADQIRDLNYTPEQLQALRDAGVLVPSETFRLETPEHVDWYAWKLKSLQAEKDAVLLRAAERADALKREMERLQALYAADAQRIVKQLVDSQKRGRSVMLDRVEVGLRRSSPRVKIVNEAALLEHLRTLADELNDPNFPLVDAVRASRTETLTGWVALAKVRYEPDEWTPKILHKPVSDYVKALPGVPDAETGEVQPATIPGVEIVPASEQLWFE